MEQKDPRQIQAELAMPFAPEDLEWRLQKTFEDRGCGIAVPYVTNRAIQTRLDDVLGAENWFNEFKPWHGADKKEAQLCGISIRFGDRFITKWDGAEDSDIEPVKGGLSDSMKRAAVQWGIGRVLYNMDAVFVDIEKKGRTWYIKKDQQEKLDYQYLKMLGKLGLTPAPAGGLRPQTGTEVISEGSKPIPQPEAKPSRSDGGEATGCVCIIRSVRLNKELGNTQLVVESTKGSRADAFVLGLHPELKAGLTLTNVKMQMKQKDTVVYYILEDYRIADIQPQAA